MESLNREATKAKAMKIRGWRALILTILYMAQGKPTLLRTLEYGVLEAGGTESDVREQAKYLHDKGYIGRRSAEEQKISQVGETFEITPAGIDLVEGTLEDPGVVF